MYKVNDIVVYRRDVCKVVGKHRSDFIGEMCYDLVPYRNQDGSVKMQVPISNKAGNLRDLITEEQIQQLIKGIVFLIFVALTIDRKALKVIK